MTPAILDHLWQSTLAALVVALLIGAFRRASAAVRYGLWFAASLKFLIPFAALTALGRVLAPAVRIPIHTGPEAMFIERATRPFSQTSLAQFPFSHSEPLQARLSLAAAAAPADHAARHLDLALVLAVVWALGCIAMLARWMVRAASIRAAVRSATPLPWRGAMPVLASSSMLEPGLVGLWRPVLLVPKSLPDHLTQSEIDAILAHEACHLRRRDNLTAAVHMLIEALFWFHPLVWWIGARLIEERERACDEAVVRSGHDRAAYARSLVECCRLYLQSPLSCMAGASGSNLETRVRMIMTAPPSSPLSLPKKTLLLAVGVCAFATPVAAGLLASPAGRQVVARATAMATGSASVRVDNARAPAPSAGPTTAPGSAAPLATKDGGAVNPITIAQSETSSTPDGPALALMASAALAPSAPAAREAPSSTVAPVTVNGTPPKVVEKLAHSFVQSYAAVANPEVDQIGRWHEAVCVLVVGLAQADQAALIKARIESVAQAVGLPATRADCHTNVEIVFTNQPQRTMDTVARRREYFLGYYHLHDRDQLKRVTRPIQSWYVTSTIGNGVATGLVLTQNPSPTPTYQSTIGVIDDPENMAPIGCGDALHFTGCYRSTFDNVFMVADSKALEGKDVGLVADYMAMLVLSQPRSLDGCNALPSVIDLFPKSACADRDTPAGLTPADASYLTALYASDPEARKAFAQGDIARRMALLLTSAKVVAR